MKAQPTAHLEVVASADVVLLDPDLRHRGPVFRESYQGLAHLRGVLLLNITNPMQTGREKTYFNVFDLID